MNLATLKQPERDQLGITIADRVANHVPRELICREFDLHPRQLDRIMKWPSFLDRQRALANHSEELALADMYLTAEEIKQEARTSFETMIDIRDNNRNEPDPKAQRLALEVSKWILEIAGHTKVQKNLNVNAGVQIPPEHAKAMLDALSQNPESDIVDIQPEQIKQLPEGTLVDASIVHRGMEVTYAQSGDRHDDDDPPTEGPKTGEDPPVPSSRR